MLRITSPHFSITMILEEVKIIKSMDKTRANITNTSSIITRAFSLRILKSNAGSFFNHFVLKGICQGLTNTATCFVGHHIFVTYNSHSGQAGGLT